MGFYVRIVKAAEDENSATYRFEDSFGAAGTLRFSKRDATTSLLTPMPGDDKKQLFARAAAKLRKEWAAGRMPDLTEWAS